MAAHLDISGDFPILARRVNGQPLTYLDSAATTQKPQAVIDAIRRYYEHYNANVHRAAHLLADEATAAMEEARRKIAALIGAGEGPGTHLHPRHHRRHQSGRCLPDRPVRARR